MRILVVEDNLINQQVAEELLVAEGAIVSLAANGQLGVDAVVAAAPQFDVVLMDIQMPVLDGYGATQMLREQLGYRDLPIVAMTANAMASDRAACLDAGMNEHVGKPFDMAKLVSLLIRVTGIAPVEHAGVTGPDIAPQTELVPVVPGLDLETALARMSGMRPLYVRTARDFIKALDTAVAEIGQHLAQGNTSAVLMRLHTLKGNAGTLGALALAHQAADLEEKCRAAGGVLECADGLKDLAMLAQQAQALLQHAVAQLVPEAPAVKVSDTSILNKSLALGALRELAGLAHASDLQVMQRYAELRQALTGLDGDFCNRLEDALQSLDLDAAHTLCQAQIAQLTQ